VSSCVISAESFVEKKSWHVMTPSPRCV
jgi:hypothetical protein